MPQAVKMTSNSTDSDKIRRELAKSFTAEDADRIMAHFYRVSGVPQTTARESSTDSEEIRRELAKSLPTEGVNEVMAHMHSFPRAPKKTARESGFYEAMTHGVSNHVVWDAGDLKNLFEVVPKGSIGRPIVSDARSPIPLCFRENKVRFVQFGNHFSRISDDDLFYLQRNHQLLSTLSVTAKDEGQLKTVEKLSNLQHLYVRAPPSMVTFRPRSSNLVRLDLEGNYHDDVSLEIPLVNLQELTLHNMGKISGLDYIQQCSSFSSLTISTRFVCRVCCESLVLPDSVTNVVLKGIDGIKNLEFGRSADRILVSDCSMLESVCLRKAISLERVDLRFLDDLVQVQSPHYMPSLDAQSMHSLKNGHAAFWRTGLTEWSGEEVPDIFADLVINEALDSDESEATTGSEYSPSTSQYSP